MTGGLWPRDAAVYGGLTAWQIRAGVTSMRRLRVAPTTSTPFVPMVLPRRSVAVYGVSTGKPIAAHTALNVDFPVLRLADIGHGR